jgi:glycosyltransferase involved in cell wall biosynthesis
LHTLSLPKRLWSIGQGVSGQPHHFDLPHHPLWGYAMRGLARFCDYLVFTPENLSAVTGVNCPIIVDDDDPEFSAAHLELLNHPNVRVVVTTTQQLKTQLLAAKLAKPCVVIPSGVDSKSLDAARVSAIGQQYNPQQLPVLGFVVPRLYTDADMATLGPEGDLRNISFLTQVMEQLWPRMPEVQLWLMGYPSNAVKAYAATHPQVKLLGYVPHDQVLNFYANFHIGLYPRSLDVQGRHSIKLLEYMACGVPVVSTDVSESFLVKEAQGGIISALDASAFAESICRLLDNAALRRELGQNGRIFARGYEWDALAARFVQEVVDRYVPG